MYKCLLFSTILMAALSSCGQNSTSSENHTKEIALKESRQKEENQQELLSLLDTYIHKEIKYIDSTGQGLILQNSLPKGGIAINGRRGYTSPDGRVFGYGQFWTRIINETAAPLDLTISFPADSFAYSSDAIGYFKLLVPQDTMTLDKLPMFNYGFDIETLRSFLNSNYNKSTTIRRRINPRGACMFYVTLLTHLDDNGAIRAGFDLKEGKLIYNININPFGSKAIVCGQVEVKD